MAGNVVEIVVKSRDETAGGFERAKAAALRAGFEAGKNFAAGAAAGAAAPAAGGGGGGPNYGMLAGIAAALPAAPALGAIAGAAFVDAIGAAILIGTAKNRGPVYDAFKDFTGQVSKTMQQAAQPLVAPLREAFASLRAFFRALGPELTQLFAASGKFIVPFAKGIEGLLSGLLPGLITLIKAGQPAFSAFGQVLGFIGKGVGGFLAALAPMVRPAAQYLLDFGKAVGQLLPIVGQLIAPLALLGPSLGKLALALVPVVKALVPLIPPLAQLVAALLPLAVRLVILLAQVLNLLVPPIAKVLEYVAKAIDWFVKWNLSAYRVYAAMAYLGAFLSRIWNDIVSGVSSMVGKVVTWFQGLPGRIVSALGNVGQLLWNSGVSIVKGLINGITSMFGSLGNVASSLASKVAGFFGLSPAKEGPLAGGGAPEVRGRHFTQALAAGMLAGLPDLGAASSGLAAGMGRMGGGYGGPGAAGRIQIVVSYDQTAVRGLGMGLLRDLRYTINTAGGGNVQAALGSA